MSDTSPLPATVGLATDVGKARMGSTNQDAVGFLELPNGGLYTVADGMGGHAAGEIASQLAIDIFHETYLQSKGHPPTRLVRAVQAAHAAILQRSVNEASGMGTTLLSLLVDKGAGILVHIGDSRAYLVRDRTLIRLTEDHSWVTQQVKQGLIAPQDAEHHELKNVVYNALGGEEKARLEIFGIVLKEGDRLLLCSDGLSNSMTDRQILQMLCRPEKPAIITRLLINAANVAGGPDNITALVLDIPKTLSLPSYYLPQRSVNGPEYADRLLSRFESNYIALYLMLGILYMTVFGLIALPAYAQIIAAVGIIGFAMVVLWQRRRKRYAASQTISLPNYQMND